MTDAAILLDMVSRQVFSSDTLNVPRKVSKADAITPKDVDFINKLISEITDTHTRLLMSLYADLRVEWATGLRCPVCARTKNQANAEDYDCTTEC